MEANIVKQEGIKEGLEITGTAIPIVSQSISGQNNQQHENKAPAKLAISPSYKSPRKIQSLDTIMKAYRTDEAGDAQLFAELFINRVVFDHAQKTWFLWDGKRWVADSSRRVTVLVYTHLAEQYERAARSYPPKKASDGSGSSEPNALARKLQARANKLRAKNRIDRILALSSSCEGISLIGDEWNKDPNLLGVANGVLDLRTASLRPARPTDYLEHHAPTEWLGLQRKAPRWEAFINEVFEGDLEIIECLQRCLGYGLSGLNSEGIMLILHGRGRNGKDTLLGTLLKVIGDQASMVSANILVASSGNPGGASPDVHNLRALRIAIASETNDEDQIRSAQVKTLTGGSPITARALYSNPITFTPQFLIILQTNTLPEANSRDYALWKRLVPFLFGLSFVDIPTKDFERRRDPFLQDKLIEESSGILAWLAQGYLDWQEEGINLPLSIINEREGYRRSKDKLGIFFEENCSFGDDFSVGATELYLAYKGHCDEIGTKPLKQASFGKRIGEDYEKIRGEGGRIFYEGISLRAPSDNELGGEEK